MVQDFKNSQTEINTVHELKNESVIYMYDECTMDVEFKALITK